MRPEPGSDDDDSGHKKPAADNGKSTTTTASTAARQAATAPFSFNTAATPTQHTGEHTPSTNIRSTSHSHSTLPSPPTTNLTTPHAGPIITTSRTPYASINTTHHPHHHPDYTTFNPTYNPPDAYQLVSRLGRGKYSEVFLAVQRPQPGSGGGRGRTVVVKVLKPVRKMKIKREIHVLQAMAGCGGCVKLLDVVRDPVSKYVSLVFEYVEAMDWKDRFQSLTEPQCQHILYQLLTTLHYAHSHGIMHRDIKPHNLLIHPRTLTARLIDWGLADYYQPGTAYNVRVCSRYFKAPELLLGYGWYDYGVDMWSVGCVMAGMLYGRHPFFHGRDNNDQLVRIVAVTGTDELYRYTTKHQLAIPDDIQHKLNAARQLQPAHRGWEALAGGGGGGGGGGGRGLRSSVALDLLGRLLLIDHQQRATVDEALAHPYFAHLHGKPLSMVVGAAGVAEEAADDMVDVEEEEDEEEAVEEAGEDDESLSAMSESEAAGSNDVGSVARTAAPQATGGIASR